ncbi:MAG: sulfatase-like hydrolase/transferase [Fuerstiella sp.]|nr:sulfatase-like hydrolase/transferase [Fuerstiella sp.]
MAIVTFLLVLSSFTTNSFAGSRPNILFIAVDDLRPELGCYGCSHIHSPNIDALAASGRLFERAYCQQAVCNPSRTSLMTGMRPDSIGVTGNHSHFRTNRPDVVTLPQHFKNHGYHTAAIGKIYHGVFADGASNTKWDTMGDPESWSVPAVRFGPRYYYTEEGIAAAKRTYESVYKPKNPGPNDWTEKLVFGPATESPDVPDSTLYDGQVADAAVKELRELKGKNRPFFLAVGFIKPHSPHIAPKNYFDLYKDVALTSHTEFPANAPTFAGHGSGELRRYTDQPKRGVISDENQRRVRQAYFACISYIDAQIGRVLHELDRSGLRDNTIIVLYGDHGYHLGEQGLWGKTTNFELDTRVPLIVRTPDMKAAGKSSSSLVELLDLYPTLAELAGLPIAEQLEGKTIVPILNDPNHDAKVATLSQYPRGDGLMGYSMRTPTRRLTQWVHRPSGEVRATELYDYADGLIETKNIAATSPEVVARLSRQLTALAGLAGIRAQDAPNNDSSSVPTSTSFEKATAGGFKKLETTIGTWTPIDGKSIIDDKHARTGKHCLQLTGGRKTSVTLNVAEQVETAGELTFWAERWTMRKPFSFRIEKQTSKGWSEIYNGDAKVRVGRSFLNHVKVRLADDSIEALRFTCSSPPDTGILIDDLRIAALRPQKIVSVKIVPVTLPALSGAQVSPLVNLKVVTTGNLNPLLMTEVQVRLHGDQSAADFTKLFVHPNKWDAEYAERPWLMSTPAVDIDDNGTGNRTYKSPLATSGSALTEGETTVGISCRLKNDANIDHRIGVQIREVRFSNGQTFELGAPPTMQRLGVAVRKGGDDGVHTYRIPGLATTNKGTLIGVYDVRRRSGGDLPGDIDVGMSRSTDGGRTWEPMKVIMDMGEDPQWNYDGVGDPAVLVDKNTGTIWVAGTWSHGNRSWRGSAPGLKPEETGQLMLVRSDDDGVTWSRPINITSQVKKPAWCFILQGPGKGITMRDGTIVFAAQYQDPPAQRRLPHSTIIYSKDHGETWQAGTGAFDDTTEAQVVEIEPGVLMLNCRYNRESVRVVMTTRDMGRTWQKHTTSERSLIEPGSCMASLIDVDQEVGKDLGNWLLFSNPDSTRGRHHLTIKASSDRGLTWLKEHRLLLDEGNSAGYSCMSMIDEKTVGILYEGSQAQMTFQRIPLSELVSPTRLRETPIDPQGSLRLPRVFGSQMVLQADSRIPVWGTTGPDEKVTVVLGHERQVTFADNSGKWNLRLQARKASAAPMVMSIRSCGETVQFKDVLIGEVWICAGQSNMEWTLRQSDSAKEELAAANHPRLRLLNLVAGAGGGSGIYSSQDLSGLKPEAFCEGEWKVASAASAASFSAVAWYFGRHLQQQLKVPVGLICPAVGGTPTEAWIPGTALLRDPDARRLVAGNWLDNPRLGEFCRTRGQQNLLAAIQAGELIPGDEFGPNHSFKPGFMWDAGIKPLIPFAIRGAIWYQGESNAETPVRVREHGQLFPLLVNQWRAKWQQGDFPFFYVQLPALNRPEWPWFRDGQRRSLSELENVGMAITIDTGHPTNVHPTLKKPVGQRLAKLALGTTYESKSKVTCTGPLLDVAEREGGSVFVSFNHVGDGLKSSDDRPLRHFEVCGRDGVFHPAKAKIIGGNTIAVSSPEVAEPHDVRYAWLPYPNPAVNLFNSTGLPASPFTTESTEMAFVRRTAAPDRPNILFIVSEDNSDHLGCYGEQRVHTPHLDALSAGGVRYTRAYVPYSVCSPSRAAFLTGLYTRQTGHIGLATHRFSMCRDFKTIPAYFQQAGYYTGFLGKTHINPERLVEDYVDHRAIQNSNFGKTISIEEYAQQAHYVMQQAEKNQKPFLLMINYADAHRKFVRKSKHGFPTQLVDDSIAPFPWIGSDTPHLREELRDYFNCMNRLDEAVGMVLDKLDENGARDNTLVVYISDHGADFPRGKGSIYEHGTRVPMIVNHPDSFPRGKVETGMVSTIDILPTMLRAARLPVPEKLPGIALQDIDSGKSPPRKYIHTFTTGSSPNLLFMQFGIRDERYKLVYSPDRTINRLAESRYRNSQLPENQHVQSFLYPPEYELFDLQEDPDEWKNLADGAEYKPVRQRLLKAMQDFQREIKDPFASRENIATFIAEQKEYQSKPYKRPGFRWPHLDLFERAQQSSE